MKIALVENFGSDFYGARLRYALFLKEKGHDVTAIVPNDGFADKIEEAGISVIALDIDIRKRSISNVYRFAKELKKIFKNDKYDIIHLYRLQPNLIGTPVAYFSSRGSKIINHITGLGMAFSKTSLKYSFITFITRTAYKINRNVFNAKIIVQNTEDKLELGNNSLDSVVKGSAVNEDKFHPNLLANQILKKELKEQYGIEDGLILLFVSRLLKQKGLSYLIEAVRHINTKSSEKKVNLLIAGWIDPSNPDSFTKDEIDQYSEIENITILGMRTDIDKLIALSDISVLPTFYREGTPRFLLESMAMGKPILTTEMPGCNHLVKKGVNGILVEPKNTESIIKGIEFLASSDLSKLGKGSYTRYHNEFSEDVVYNQLLTIYNN